MSIEPDDRAETFGYTTEAEKDAWSHGVFQGRLDAEGERWADSEIARDEAAALLHRVRKDGVGGDLETEIEAWLDRYEHANAADTVPGRPVGQDPRECGKKCGPAGAGGTYPVCGRPPEHRGDCALRPTDADRDIKPNNAPSTSYANTWASACDWFEAAANAKDDGPLMSLVGAARGIAPGRHVLPEGATLDDEGSLHWKRHGLLHHAYVNADLDVVCVWLDNDGAWNNKPCPAWAAGHLLQQPSVRAPAPKPAQRKGDHVIIPSDYPDEPAIHVMRFGDGDYGIAVAKGERWPGMQAATMIAQSNGGRTDGAWEAVANLWRAGAGERQPTEPAPTNTREPAPRHDGERIWGPGDPEPTDDEQEAYEAYKQWCNRWLGVDFTNWDRAAFFIAGWCQRGHRGDTSTPSDAAAERSESGVGIPGARWATAEDIPWVIDPPFRVGVVLNDGDHCVWLDAGGFHQASLGGEGAPVELVRSVLARVLPPAEQMEIGALPLDVVVRQRWARALGADDDGRMMAIQRLVKMTEDVVQRCSAAEDELAEWRASAEDIDYRAHAEALQAQVDSLKSSLAAPKREPELEHWREWSKLFDPYPEERCHNDNHRRARVTWYIEMLTGERPRDGVLAEPAHKGEPAPFWMDEFMAERQRQDAQWGGEDHDDDHSAADWMDYIARQCRRGNEEAEQAKDWDDPALRRRLVNIGAMVIAALESWDRRWKGTSYARSGRFVAAPKVEEGPPEDRSEPPPGYMVTGELVGKRWVRRAEVERGEPFATSEEAVAECWAHHDAIVARARGATQETYRWSEADVQALRLAAEVFKRNCPNDLGLGLSGKFLTLADVVQGLVASNARPAVKGDA